MHQRDLLPGRARRAQDRLELAREVAREMVREVHVLHRFHLRDCRLAATTPSSRSFVSRCS